MNKKIICLGLSLFLTNCASITTGKHQSISVNTYPEVNAMCQLSNDKGTWYVNSTPGSIIVHRSHKDLTIICRKDQKSGTAQVKSSIKNKITDILSRGGLIGLAIDAHTEAGYDYPSSITVPLY